jgi:DeoR/GlpR family transcriptional regulator of sugar metabolism
VGLSTFATLDQVDTLVTDAGLPAEIRAAAAEQVRELVIAGSAGEDADGAAES